MLILEDGTKPLNANAYCTVEFADAYHAMLGNDDWSGDVATKEALIIKATMSLDLLYGPRYISSRLPGVQSLLWPRLIFVDQNSIIRGNNEVPIEVQKAVAQHALNIMNGVDPFPQSTQQANIKNQRTKVGEIETQIDYRTPVDTETFPGYNLVELLLWAVLRKKGVSPINLSR